MAVDRIPPALDTVRIPTHLSPSTLAGIDSCLLRVIGEIDPAQDRLPGGLAAMVGTFVHSVLEEVSRTKDTVSWPDGINAIMARELDRIDGKLCSDRNLVPMAPLRVAMGEHEWARRRAYIIRVSRLIGARGSMSPHTSRDSGLDRLNLDLRRIPVGAVWSEVPLESARLRLKGRADRIQRDQKDVYSIVDFKTGSASDEDGNLRESVRIQMFCYGLILADLLQQSVRISLKVDDGVLHEVPFDQASGERTVQSLLIRFRELGEPGNELPAARLATPGNVCVLCSIRHRCRTYIENAPHWWATPPAGIEQVPMDIWGRVKSVKTGTAYETLDMVDCTGRTIRVRGLDPRHGIGTMSASDGLFFFGLKARSVPRDRMNRALPPINFYEVPDDPSGPRAWGLKCFSAPA
jgi:hypothetical protein